MAKSAGFIKLFFFYAGLMSCSEHSLKPLSKQEALQFLVLQYA